MDVNVRCCLSDMFASGMISPLFPLLPFSKNSNSNSGDKPKTVFSQNT